MNLMTNGWSSGQELPQIECYFSLEYTLHIAAQGSITVPNIPNLIEQLPSTKENKDFKITNYLN